jgi:RsiW-degrading membrane proteinase PrsW (M82 family)
MEQLLFPLCVATIPVILLLAYFWHRDKGEKEPWPLMRRVFICGLFITIPAGIFEYVVDNYGWNFWQDHVLLYAVLMPFIFTALPEEFAKLFVVRQVAYDHPKFNELMDGITYTVIASLGFALFENVLYTLQYGADVGFMRAFTAVPAHALFSGVMGYAVGRAKFAKTKEEERKLFSRALFIGVIFHGLYDFLLMSGLPYLILLVFPLMAYMATQLNFAIRLANSKKAEELDYF